MSGNDQPAASTAFGFTVDCTVGAQPVDLNGSAAGSQAVFTLTAAQAPMVFSNLPGGATCTVTETNAQGADSTSITVDGVAAATGNVTIGSGTTRTVVFTNVFDVTPVTVPPTPVPASLTVEKDVTGDVPDEWEFTFGLRGGDTNELFTLDQGDDDEAFTVPAGTYVLTEFEVPNDRATLIDVECDDAGADIDDGVVTLALAAGDDVTCTFTNDFAEVAPSVVTTTTTTTTTTVAPTTTTTTVAPAAVLGESVTRLPRTGTHTGELAALGVLLIGLGATMVLVGRRREAVDL
ncbi:MAG TPA: DUF5979 domain-containing protein [Acidimicrobiales bacterium]|nr:DUF5979 domain-containing protein [Acidimicrobiales bacterium]